ncbi:hypothetical protein Tco_1130604 [Tanacetum coccineum]
MSNLKFAETHNLVAFLEKPKESDGFEGIIDFLNASSIRYALTVNPTIYTSCIKQFWATAKAKTINGEVQIQALVDGKKVIVTEMSVRRALQLKDAEGTECLPNATIFAELERMGQGKDFSGRDTHLFPTMIVQAQEQEGEGSVMPTVPCSPNTHPPINQTIFIHNLQRKQKLGRPKKRTLSGEDRLKLNELMELCTNLSQKVLDLENTKTSQAAEITKLKERVKKIERRNKSRTLRLKRLRKKINDLDADADAKVTLVDEAQERNDDNLMFDTGVFYEQEVKVEKVVSTTKVTTTSATTTTIDELTMAQTLKEIKVLA